MDRSEKYNAKWNHCMTLIWGIENSQRYGSRQWNNSSLEKCCRWSYLQNRNGDTDVENKYLDTKGKRGGGMN